jgi:hypothetical protein
MNPIGRDYPQEKLRDEIQGNKRGIQYPKGSLWPLVLDLSSAQAVKEFASCKGNVIYVDSESTGSIRIGFDTAWQKLFPMGPNSGFRGIPFEQLLIEWDAQPGRVATLWYGYGADYIPSNQDITTIGNITNPVQTTREYASSFSSTTALAAGTAETVFAPGSNLSGAEIVAWSSYARQGGGGDIATFLRAHTSAPATQLQGDGLAGLSSGLGTPGTSLMVVAKLDSPIRIAANLGLYHLTTLNLESATAKSVLYTL